MATFIQPDHLPTTPLASDDLVTLANAGKRAGIPRYHPQCHGAASEQIVCCPTSLISSHNRRRYRSFSCSTKTYKYSYSYVIRKCIILPPASLSTICLLHVRARTLSLPLLHSLIKKQKWRCVSSSFFSIQIHGPKRNRSPPNHLVDLRGPRDVGQRR